MWRALSAVLVLLGVLVARGPAAQAQEAPLRMVFVNSDPMDGTGVYDALDQVLEASNDLEMVAPGDFLSAGDDNGVTLDTLRDGDRRPQYAATFAKMLKAAGAESVVVLDVFGGGHTVQLVAIGPDGKELGDIRKHIDGNVPSRDESVDALKQVFRVLVPAVRKYRQEQKAKKAQKASVGLVDEHADEDGQPGSIKARVIAEHRRNHANLHTGITPHVGMVFGRRKLTLDTQAAYNLNHSSPYVGFGAQIDAIFALMDGDTTAIGASIFGAYAPFTTVFSNDAGQPVELPSSYTNASVDLNYIKGIGRDLVVKGFVGAETSKITIQQNQAYTGNSYLSLRGGAGLTYKFGELAALNLQAAALPIVSADLSGDTMGKADVGLGLDGSARLDVIAFKPFEVSLGYDFHYYRVTFPHPKLSDLGGQSATTTDLQHLANVMVGYGF